MKTEVQICVEQIAEQIVNSHHGYYVNVESVFKKWLCEKKFSRQVLSIVIQAVVDLHLSEEWQSHGYAYDVSCEARRGAELMASLGFFEEAVEYYHKAIEIVAGHSLYEGAAYRARESMFKLAVYYRRNKGHQQIPALNGLVEEVVSGIVAEAEVDVIKRIKKGESWNTPLEHARRLLSMMNIDDAEETYPLRPVYRRVVSTLIADRENFIKKYKYKPEEVDYRSEDISKAYLLLGDKKKSRKWKDIYLVARRFYLKNWIANYSNRIKRLKEEYYKEDKELFHFYVRESKELYKLYKEELLKLG